MRAFIAGLLWAAVGLAYGARYGSEALKPPPCLETRVNGHSSFKCGDTGVTLTRLRAMASEALRP